MTDGNGFPVAQSGTAAGTGDVQAVADEVLIHSVCGGDTRSFALLVSRYKKRVLSLGMSFFRNVTDAEDFTQDVFIKVFTNLSSFRRESKFSTWMMRIAYNTAINSVKRRREYASLSDEVEIMDTGEGPEEKHIRCCTCDAIREALRELPDRFAVCLDMYFFYDMSYGDISEVTELPVNTIKSHVFRAKKILRDKLSGTIAERLQ